MSLGYHEWPGVLFISVWRASVCSSPGRKLCCLDVETGNRGCTKNPILVLWMQFIFHTFKLKEEPHIQESRPSAEKLLPPKKLPPSTATDMHFLSSSECFPMWFISMIKRKNCSFEYVMKGMPSSLHKSDCFLATESHRVYTIDYQD